MNFITTPWCKEDIELFKQEHVEGVILPVPFFSVRKMNAFPVETLKDLIKECQEANIKTYVPVNRFFIEEELEQLKEFLKQLKEWNADYIYFTDEGVLQTAKELGMEDRLIYNPDTLITNAFDAQYYLDEGIARVCISREITLEEICTIAKKVKDASKLEVMIHGRLPMMHSKRELLTNYMTFLEKDYPVKNNYNLYLIESTRDDHMPIIEDEHGTHVFSGFTLTSFEEIETLKDAGIVNVRIEGMFHDGAYSKEAFNLYYDILNGTKTAKEVYEEYQEKYKEDNITKGFYYTKTSKTK